MGFQVCVTTAGLRAREITVTHVHNGNILDIILVQLQNNQCTVFPG